MAQSHIGDTQKFVGDGFAFEDFGSWVKNLDYKNDLKQFATFSHQKIFGQYLMHFPLAKVLIEMFRK